MQEMGVRRLKMVVLIWVLYFLSWANHVVMSSSNPKSSETMGS
jgi:hypothetical protein